MIRTFRFLLASVSVSLPGFCIAQIAPIDCPRQQVDAHVVQEMSVYGPLSVNREFFAFIYVHNGLIASAVVRGNVCRSTDQCTMKTGPAAALIPRGAKVLGEWHTHPHDGAAGLSKYDVRGAFNNRRISCYAAFYAKPNGEILRWDPHQTSVPTAMNSRVRIGSYRDLAGVTTAGNVR